MAKEKFFFSKKETKCLLTDIYILHACRYVVRAKNKFKDRKKVLKNTINYKRKRNGSMLDKD
jgi:hypothetical protein